MAIFKNSTFGTIRKSIGDDVAYRLGGQNIIRKKPAYVNDANSEAQQYQRAALTLIVKLFRNISGLIRITFPEREAKLSAYNRFVSVNLNEAIENKSGVPEINYSKLSVSSGSLPSVDVSIISEDKAGNVKLEIKNVVDDTVLFPNHKLVIAYIDVKNRKYLGKNEYKLSSPMPTTINLKKLLNSGDVAVYMFFENARKTKVSDSINIGVFSY